MQRAKRFQVLQWSLGACAVLAGYMVWAIGRGAGPCGVFEIFPLFGLLAFGLMWTHFVNAAVRRWWGLEKKRDTYWVVSSGVVLFTLLAHPVLLNYGLVRDGLGLPPASYTAAYPGREAYLFMGTLALVIFLVYELHRIYADRTWWWIVDKLQIVAMVVIYVHALLLGSDMGGVFAKGLWGFYLATLSLAVIYSWYFDTKKEEANDGEK